MRRPWVAEESSLLHPILSQLNLIHVVALDLFKTNLNIIFRLRQKHYKITDVIVVYLQLGSYIFNPC